MTEEQKEDLRLKYKAAFSILESLLGPIRACLLLQEKYEEIKEKEDLDKK